MFPHVFGTWGWTLTPHEVMLAKGYNVFNSPTIETVTFCQVLAKIAHGMAIAQFGLSAFRPLLIDPIRVNSKKGEIWMDRYSYVGGILESYHPTDDLHLVCFSLAECRDVDYLTPKIGCFHATARQHIGLCSARLLQSKGEKFHFKK